MVTNTSFTPSFTRPFSLPFILSMSLALVLSGCASTAQGPASSSGSAQSGSTFSFGLWGDMPYKKAGDDAKLPAVLRSINQSDIAFSIYDGDIKDGSSQCTDSVFADALTMFNSLAKPVVYVPGDNEWTDCHRLNNGGFDTLERLAHLRRVMFPAATSLGQTRIPLFNQGAPGTVYAENTRFSFGGVVFVGINMPGSNNNVVANATECTYKSARTLAQCEAANAEYAQRDAANVQWLQAAFAHAKATAAVGVVLVVQADPGFDLPETEDVDESTLPRYSGYRNFMKQLAQQTQAYAGQVLFVHGDTHFFKLDKPLPSPTQVLPNFTRLQTFGSPSLHWVKVTVDVASPNVFLVQPVMVKQP